MKWVPTMTGMEIRKLDTTDDEAVADYLSEYLNCHPTGERSDFWQVLSTFPHHGHNFLVLALHWFYRLRNVTPKPGNAAAVELARAVSEKAGLNPDYYFFDLIRPAKLFESADVLTQPADMDAAVALAYYLSEFNATDAVYEHFIEKMLADHPTIQQSFTRLIVEWCRWIDREADPDSKGKTATLARMICSCYKGLPYN